MRAFSAHDARRRAHVPIFNRSCATWGLGLAVHGAAAPRPGVYVGPNATQGGMPPGVIPARARAALPLRRSACAAISRHDGVAYAHAQAWNNPLSVSSDTHARSLGRPDMSRRSAKRAFVCGLLAIPICYSSSPHQQKPAQLPSFWSACSACS